MNHQVNKKNNMKVIEVDLTEREVWNNLSKEDNDYIVIKLDIEIRNEYKISIKYNQRKIIHSSTSSYGNTDRYKYIEHTKE